MVYGNVFFTTGLVILNHLAPPMSDDYVYSFIYGGDGIHNTQRISSWKDVIESNCTHYLRVNGRFVVHVLVQTFLWGGKDWIWSILNTLCLLTNAWLIFALACPRERFPHRTAGYLLTLVLYWLLLPLPGHTFFWVSGSCNYQWASLLILSFLHLWNMPHNRWAMWLALPIGLSAGNSNEALSLGLGISLILYTLIRYRSLTRMQKLAVLVFLVGLATNIKAPGVALRLQRGGIDAPLWMSVLFRAIRGSMELIRNQIHVIVLPGIFLSLAFWRAFKTGKLSFPYLPVAILLSMGAAVYSQEINSRSTFACYLFSFVLALPIIIQFFNSCTTRVRYSISAFLAVLVVGTGVYAGYTLHTYARIEQHFFQQLQKNESPIWPDGDFYQSRYIACAAMPNENPASHFNRFCAAYYQIKPFSSGREDHTPWRRLLTEASSIEPGRYRLSEDGNYILAKFPHTVDYGTATGYVNPQALTSTYDKLVRRMFAWKSYDCNGGVWNHNGGSYAIIQSGPKTATIRIRTSNKLQKEMWSLNPGQSSGILKQEAP